MCTPICDGSEYRCLDCGRVWDFGDEPPKNCEAETKEATREITQAERYKLARDGEL